MKKKEKVNGVVIPPSLKWGGDHTSTSAPTAVEQSLTFLSLALPPVCPQSYLPQAEENAIEVNFKEVTNNDN